MFARKPAPRSDPAPAPAPVLPALEAGEMALDTIAGMLRSMGEFALEQEGTDPATFREQAEAWARHVTLAAPVTGARDGRPTGPAGRRDWHGVRQFVRDYCRSSAGHAAGVAGGLREVIWAFIRNFSHAAASSEEADRRLREQVARLERLVEGSPASELKREVLQTVGTLAQVFEEQRQRQHAQMAQLGETVRALGHELESARREGEMDPLTRVFNRKALDAYLERTVEVHHAFRHEACLVVVDVDHFKGINDAFGHAAGDAVLCAVANAIGKVFLRRSDFVARFGGDEFAVVLRETRLREAILLAGRVVAGVSGAGAAGPDGPRASVSVGVAAIGSGDDARTWFDRADRALYRAKKAGRGRLEAPDDLEGGGAPGGLAG